ncbi:MAG TPA: hypothetical protein VGN57_19690 [Pirellulaceae bacterium]|jgi:hypothetical protein|nr:hypothetical protein [Pirellulaceae bacterium]
MHRAFRFSIAESLLLFASIAAIYAALRFAGETLAGVLLLATALAAMAAAAFAIFGRGAVRDFAVGALIGFVAYGALLALPTIWEEYRLPTTRWTEPLHERFRTIRWERGDTGEEKFVRNLGEGKFLDERGVIIEPLGNPAYDGWAIRGHSPDRATFDSVVHLVCAWIFAYLGTLLARLTSYRPARPQET